MSVDSQVEALSYRLLTCRRP